MQETLHFPSTTFHLDNPQFPFISRPNHLQLPPKSSAVAPPSLLEPLPHQIPRRRMPNDQFVYPLQELILYLDSLGVDSLYCLHSHPPLISTLLDQVKCTVDFLFSLGLPHRAASPPYFPHVPDLLTSPTSTVIIPAATFLLRVAHVDAVNFRHVTHRRPRLLTRSVDRQLRPTSTSSRVPSALRTLLIVPLFCPAALSPSSFPELSTCRS